MQVNYWVHTLNNAAVFGIAWSARRSGNLSVSAVYVHKFTFFLLKTLLKLKGISFQFHKIKERTGPAGPVLDIYKVRNDKHEVIIMDIYRHVLAIRRKIIARLREHYQQTELFKDKRPISMIMAYLGMKIAEEITPSVFLADFVKWYDSNETEKQHKQDILIIPRSPWTPDLLEDFAALGIRVQVMGREHSRVFTFLRALKTATAAFLKAGFSLPESLSFNNHLKHPKVMVTYAMGLREDRRNDISFYFASQMDPSRLLVYFKVHPGWLSPEELQWLEENNISRFASPTLPKPVPGVTAWTSTPLYRKLLKQFAAQWLRTLVQSLKGKSHTAWMMDRFWKMGVQVCRWQDFFITNQVGIITHSVPSDHNFIPHMAITQSGGIAASIERSILFDYCTYIHNPPNHLHFITGAYSLKQISEPSFSLNTVISGGLNVDNHNREIEGVEALKKDNKILIALLDEMPNDVFFGDSVEEMYQSFIDLLKTDGRFRLLIKSKKPQVLERLSHIREQIEILVKEGKCVHAPWRVSAADAAAHCDFVVGVPSTAVFESVLAGTRTIVYNPMVAGSSLFYENNGLGRRVFHDAPAMVQAMVRFADGADDSVGDCSDIAAQIDPHNDGLGAKRIGDYFKRTFTGLEQQLPIDDIIQQANHEYAQQWGADHIIRENAYEYQDEISN